jgi:drug/metabolite transporter (DMT)-like permease
MSSVFALLAALANALNVMAQHIASVSDPAQSKGWRFIVYLFRNPLWLLGWVFLIGAFVFQAVALHNGQLSVVQTLLVTELVFGLILRRLWIHQRISPLAWASAGLTCLGVALFVAMGEPQGGNPTPTSHAWWAAFLVCGVLAGLMTVLAQWGPPGRRAGCYAVAAATVWAFVATVIKATTDTLTQFGVTGMLTRWPVYVLVVGGIVGTVLVQAAIHVGPLRISQPLLVIVDPVLSIYLSVQLYAEHFTDDAVKLTLAALGFVAMCAGVVLLTRTAPSSMTADVGG